MRGTKKYIFLALTALLIAWATAATTTAQTKQQQRNKTAAKTTSQSSAANQKTATQKSAETSKTPIGKASAEAKMKEITDTTSEKEKLRLDMYKYFGVVDSANFFKATEQLKEVCLMENDEKLFYKAWGNEAILTFNHLDRQRGMNIAQEMRDYANKNDSKYGLYTSMQVIGAFLSAQKQTQLAKIELQKALEYHDKYFPDESIAAALMTLSKISHNEGDYEGSKQYSQRVIDSKDAIMQHKMPAYSMYALSAIAQKDSAAFLDIYEKRKKYAEENNNYIDNYEELVQMEYFILKKRYKEAEKLAMSMKSKSSKYAGLAKIYQQMGDYKKAFYYHVKYKENSDSINNEAMAQRANEYAAEIGLVKAENEAKDLRLSNQRMKTRFLYISAIILLLFSIFFFYRRRKQILKLRKINKQLEETGEQLKISEQKEHKARLEAERALRVKRNFLNNISHEMRTPLNSISGFSQILTEMGDQLPKEEKKELNGRINESTETLTDIVDKMIELSHYDTMESVDKNDNVSPAIICQKAAEEWQEKAKPGVKVLTVNNLPEGYTIKSNAKCIEKILSHLLDNATKFTDSGKIALQTDICPDNENCVVISVADTGTGIPKEKQEDIFELFSDTGEQVKTTGMGLSICQTICRLLNGSIHLDTDYTNGCRIVVNIPSEK